MNNNNSADFNQLWFSKILINTNCDLDNNWYLEAIDAWGYFD